MARFDLPIDELQSRRSGVARPHDFDDFWSTTIASARRHDTPVRRTPHTSTLALVDIDDVVFPGFDGDPVRAWFVRPSGFTEPLPAIVEFVGYGRGRGLPHERLHWPVAGYTQLIVDARGQGSTSGTGGDTPDPHGTGPSTGGMLTRGIEDPERYYYRRVFTDAVRAVDAVRGFDEVDASRVIVTGNSQGGIITIAAAGLTHGLVAAMPTLPILCDTPRVIGLTDAAPHSEISTYLAVHRGSAERVFETLSYFDGVNLARAASAPGFFAAALLDTIAPPSGVYAAFNEWGHEEREIVTYPWNGHQGGEGLHWELQSAWLSTVLGTRENDL